MIRKVGGKFRVVSESGKNLGESESKGGAVKRLRQVEWFKHHAKSLVDPELVKDRMYQPVVFQTEGHTGSAEKESRDKDFPSTPQAYDLKDVKQPEFPSAPFSGEAYADSFHNPTAGQGNEPDIQKKGSDFTPAYATIQPNLAKKSLPGSDVSNANEETLRISRAAITPSLDQNLGHVNPIRQSIDKRIRQTAEGSPKSIRQIAVSNAPGGSGYSANTGSSTGSGMSRSIKLAGRKVILKQHPNEFAYPVDKGPDSREFDQGEESQKRKDFFRRQQMEEKAKEHARAQADKPELKYNSYLGRSKDADKIGEFSVTNPKTGTKVRKFKPIDPREPSRVLSIHYGPKDVEKREKRRTLKAVMYTQNQPLDPSLKPIVFIKDDKDEKKPTGLKIITFTAQHVGKSKEPMTTEEVHEKIRRTTRKPEGPRLHKPWKRPDLGPDALPADSPVHDPDFDKWARDYNKKFKSEYPAPVGGKTGQSAIKLRRTFNDPAGTGQKDEGWDPKEKEKKTKKSDRPNPIKGGIGDKLDPKDVDPDELEAGIGVEQEHVGKNEDWDEDKKRAAGQDIALDHLKEDPEYYTRLKEMERKAKQENKDKTKAKKILKMGDKSVVFTFSKALPASNSEIERAQHAKDREYFRGLPRSTKEKYSNPYNQHPEAVHYRWHAKQPGWRRPRQPKEETPVAKGKYSEDPERAGHMVGRIAYDRDVWNKFQHGKKEKQARRIEEKMDEKHGKDPRYVRAWKDVTEDI